MIVTVIAAGARTDPTDEPHDERAEVGRFADALGRALGTTVGRASFAEMPSEGVLVVFETATAMAYHRAARRTVLINADRAEMRDVCERLHLLAAVEKHRYFRWRNAPDDEHGRGLYARKDVASHMPGVEVTGMYPSPLYGMLSSSEHPDLVRLIAAYLRAAERQGMLAADEDDPSDESAR